MLDDQNVIQTLVHDMRNIKLQLDFFLSDRITALGGDEVRFLRSLGDSIEWSRVRIAASLKIDEPMS